MSEIRPALQGEVDDAIDAWLDANAGHEVPGHAQHLREWAAQEGAVLYIARSSGDVVEGMVLCLPGRADDGRGPVLPGLLHLTGLAVRPEHQRKGLGRALLDAVMCEAQRRDCARVTLWTKSANLVAQRIFESRGFRQTGRTALDAGGSVMVQFQHDADSRVTPLP